MASPKHIEFDGYRWCLSNGYYKRSVFISLHRYVWEKHHGPIPEGHHIHHIDGNKTNNNISNLECLTVSDHHKRTWKENYEKMCKVTHKNMKPYKRTKKIKKAISRANKKAWKKRERVSSNCKNCGKTFFTKKPEAAGCCIRCLKDRHYHKKQETRKCRLCNKIFKCYIYSKTFSCSQSCAAKQAWITIRNQKNDVADQQSNS